MEPTHAIPGPSAAALAAAAELRRLVAGRVSTTAVSRWLYSTDSSGYRVVPEAVLVAGDVGDLVGGGRGGGRARAAGHGARRRLEPGRPGHRPRARHRLLQARPDRRHRSGPQDGARRARRRPGVAQRRGGAVRARVRPRHLDGRPGDHRRHGRQQLVRLALDRLRPVQGQGAPDRGGAERRGRRRPRARRLGTVRRRGWSRGRDLDGRGARTRRGGHRRGPRGDPRALGGGDRRRPPPDGALHVGLQPARAARTRAQSRPAPGRLRGHAGAVRGARGRAGPAARTARRGGADLRLAAGGARGEHGHPDDGPLRGGAARPGAAAGDAQARGLPPHVAAAPRRRAGDADRGVPGRRGRGARGTRAPRRRRRPILGAVQVALLTDTAALAEAGALRRAALPLLMGAPGAERARLVRRGHRRRAGAPRRVRRGVPEPRRAARRPRLVHRACIGGLPPRAAPSRPQDGRRRRAHGRAGARRRQPGARLPRRHLGRARLRPFAVVVPSGALRPRSDGRLRRAQGGVRPGRAARARHRPRRRRRSPSTSASARATAPTAPGGRGCPTAPRAASTWRSRSASAPGSARSSAGTMCPPAAATRDEALSTRARANVLQGILCGALPFDGPNAAELRDVLGTCVACKACKNECPAGVDMAALKVEWLAELRGARGRAAAGARDRRLPPPRAPGGAVRAARQRRRPHLTRAPRGRLAPVSPANARCRPSRRCASAAWRRAMRDPTWSSSPTASSSIRSPRSGTPWSPCCAPAAAASPSSTPGAAAGRRSPRADRQGAPRRGRRRSPTLAPHAAAGRAVAFVEPSCYSMAADDWARLLPGDERVALVAGAARLGQALVAEDAAAGRLRFAGGGRAVLHPHCHERAVAGLEAERSARCAPSRDSTSRSSTPAAAACRASSATRRSTTR